MTEPPQMSESIDEGRRHACEVEVSALRLGDSPRHVAVDEGHVQVLAEVGLALPPIVVHRATMTVIDGWHRLAAARLRGDRTIVVEFFDGSEEEAFVESVRANVRHGRPLNLHERRAAAGRILALHPEYSDRSLASICGLSPKTVASVRTRQSVPAATERVGRDGRVRPVDPSARRREISAVLDRDPTQSTAAVARAVGASPNTVRDVRTSLPRPRRSPPPKPNPSVADDHRWDGSDSAYIASEPARRFAEWFAARQVRAADWEPFVAAVPLSRIYVVVDAARATARAWESFASALEEEASRASRRSASGDDAVSTSQSPRTG